MRARSVTFLTFSLKHRLNWWEDKAKFTNYREIHVACHLNQKKCSGLITVRQSCRVYLVESEAHFEFSKIPYAFLFKILVQGNNCRFLLYMHRIPICTLNVEVVLFKVIVQIPKQASILSFPAK